MVINVGVVKFFVRNLGCFFREDRVYGVVYIGFLVYRVEYEEFWFRVE